jgi:hypothetical protein
VSREDHTPEEWAALRAEAQRRVRAGEAAAQVARALDVPIATFQHWQAEDGFRKKDLENEALMGTRLPSPVWLVKNRERGKPSRRRSPAGYLNDVAEKELRLSARKAEMAEARKVDTALAGRTAMGEAVRLHEAGDVAAAERTARLAERFLRMQARIEGKLDRSTKAQREAFARAEKDKLMNDPANPDRTIRDRVLGNLNRLIERLERQKREREEAEAAAAADLSAGSAFGEAAQGLGRLAEGAEEGAAHPLGVAEA